MEFKVREALVEQLAYMELVVWYFVNAFRGGLSSLSDSCQRVSEMGSCIGARATRTDHLLANCDALDLPVELWPIITCVGLACIGGIFALSRQCVYHIHQSEWWTVTTRNTRGTSADHTFCHCSRIFSVWKDGSDVSHLAVLVKVDSSARC